MQNSATRFTTKYLKDYTPLPYDILTTSLEFHIQDQKTTLRNVMVFSLKPECPLDSVLILDGPAIDAVQEVKFNDNKINFAEFCNSEGQFQFNPHQDKFVLEFVTELFPRQNTTLMGLYQTGEIYCTQCEAEGFRKMTYFYDRPDAMSRFTTKIIASKKFQYLLSNGNKISSGVLDSEEHFVIWEDPYLKPCYLFALVVGNFDKLTDSFLTQSQRLIKLELFVDAGMQNYATHAMTSLKKAMKWDEEYFNLEYDLDLFMIVAVDSFNGGAMENKGLNIFNAKYILGNDQTATDLDLDNIEAVVAHEYFHNWTGNRITCRDWFQLTLKEGLTVFREQRFCEILHSKSVKRIFDVILLRQKQFSEDAGPLSHPIRPDSYIEISNFYTMTVYEKGAEVIRMMESIIGESLFKKGISQYVALFDGKAITTDDFVFALEKASGFDFTYFKRWYHTRGTPEVQFRVKNFLTNSQRVQVIIEQKGKNYAYQEPLVIPLKFALVSKGGPVSMEQIVIKKVAGSEEKLHSCFVMSRNDSLDLVKIVNQQTEVLLLLQDFAIELEFDFLPNIDWTQTVFSWNRNFTAPVHVVSDNDIGKLQILAQFDSDDFTRWDSQQVMMKKLLTTDAFFFNDSLSTATLNLLNGVTDSLFDTLKNISIDPNFKSKCLTLPNEQEIHDECRYYKIEMVRNKLQFTHSYIAKKLELSLKKTFFELQNNASKDNKLLNTILFYLMMNDDLEVQDYCWQQLINPRNMTDEFAALSIFNQLNHEKKLAANEHFIKKWSHHPQLVDKWFSVQMSNLTTENMLETLLELEKNALFSFKIPNRVYALHCRFMQNLPALYEPTGAAFALICERIKIIDQINPQVSSRMSKLFLPLNKLEAEKCNFAQKYLRSLLEYSKLSKDCYEVLSKIMA